MEIIEKLMLELLNKENEFLEKMLENDKKRESEINRMDEEIKIMNEKITKMNIKLKYARKLIRNNSKKQNT
jgi:hypothetical protein